MHTLLIDVSHFGIKTDVTVLLVITSAFLVFEAHRKTMEENAC
jgi:hypothetical protein